LTRFGIFAEQARSDEEEVAHGWSHQSSITNLVSVPALDNSI
jgi:hypothetical protein